MKIELKKITIAELAKDYKVLSQEDSGAEFAFRHCPKHSIGGAYGQKEN